MAAQLFSKADLHPPTPPGCPNPHSAAYQRQERPLQTTIAIVPHRKSGLQSGHYSPLTTRTRLCSRLFKHISSLHNHLTLRQPTNSPTRSP